MWFNLVEPNEALQIRMSEVQLCFIFRLIQELHAAAKSTMSNRTSMEKHLHCKKKAFEERSTQWNDTVSRDESVPHRM